MNNRLRLLLAIAAITLTPAAWSATTATGGTGTTTGVCQQTGASPNGNLACGQGATASASTYGGAIAISPQGGQPTTASGDFSIAVGSDTTASGLHSVAVGPGATSSGAGSVALGAGSSDGGQSNVVSVGGTFAGGQRKIINVAGGTLAFGSTDAATAGQLFASTSQLAWALGGGASATATGLMPPAYTINGATYTDVGSALQALDNKPTPAGLCQYSASGGIVCGHNTTAAASAVAQGDGASASYAGSLAIGQGATITAPTSADGMTTGAVAIGQGAQANADPATAIGYQANAAGANSVAIGAGATANGSNAVALGAGSVANRANSVSVGSATQQRQITNVAPATQPTDAPNLGQVQGLIGQATSGILSQANQHADQVAAMAAATSMTPQFGPKGYALTAAVAGVGSQSAMGIGFARAFQFHDHPAYWQASVGFNGNSGTAAVKVGGSIGW
ncbi:hypothetical protein [Thiomonas sp.]|uniref:YadA family autotransporter adhesin n=1 Tax=Thiomonas sp. TaxID=2047785 RepID=UPI00258A175D|nr:hypothetical protein [Thiomonas sp.]